MPQHWTGSLGACDNLWYPVAICHQKSERMHVAYTHLFPEAVVRWLVRAWAQAGDWWTLLEGHFIVGDSPVCLWITSLIPELFWHVTNFGHSRQ
jgi:hypothetical protein